MTHPAIHELQQHGAALRRLARDLVGSAAADDVLQDAAIEVLRTPPAAPGPLLGWLRAVVRHVAGKQRRAAAVRRRHELAAARDEVFTANGAEAADTLRWLTACVTSLPEPYRSTLLARYLREQTPSEIAAASGEPVRTVKTRLQRGLALLRERFDADGRDWRAAFGVAFGLREAGVGAGAGVGGVAAITTGIFWMSTTTKWAFAAVALVAVGFGLWQLGPSVGEPVARTEARAEPVVAAGPSVVAPPSAPAGAKAQEPERTAPPITIVPIVRATAEQIVVHVTDAASGAPIESFALREHISTLEAVAGSDRPLHHFGAHPNGRLVVPVTLFERRGFVVECDDARYLPSPWITAADALQRDGERAIEVRMPPAVDVTVRVVHGRTGDPVAGARVELLRAFQKGLPITRTTRAQPTTQFAAHPDADAGSWMERIRGGRALLLGAAVTAADGRVQLRVPLREPCTLRLPGPGHRAVLQADWTVAEHEANGERVVVVPTGASVRGRVLSQTVLQQLRSVAAASNGAAPPLVQLQDRAGTTSQAPIDADGHFRCEGLEPGDCQVWFHYSLRLLADGQEPAAGKLIAIELPKLVGLTEGETRELDIDLTGWLPGTLVFTVPNDARVLPGHLSLDPLQSLGPPMPSSGMGALDLAPGKRVAMTLPPGRYAAEWFNQGAKESLWLGAVDVRSGETLTAAPALMARSLQVRVVAGEEQIVAGGLLTLHGSRWNASRTLDVSGSATFDALPIGLPLRASFLGEGRQQPEGKVVVPQLDLGPLQLEAGTPELITLRLPAR